MAMLFNVIHHLKCIAFSMNKYIFTIYMAYLNNWRWCML